MYIFTLRFGMQYKNNFSSSLLVELLRLANPILTQIYTHPINQQLASGFLSNEIFARFLVQDEYYLDKYLKAMQLTSERLNKQTHIKAFKSFVNDTQLLLNAVKDVFIVKYCTGTSIDRMNRAEIETPTDRIIGVEKLQNSAEKSKDEKMNSTCFKYAEYLIQLATDGTVEEAVSSLFPCFYIYHELGVQMSTTLKTANPYHDWLSTYTNQPEFTESLLTFIEILDDLSSSDQQIQSSNTNGQTDEKTRKMAAAFYRSTEFELHFLQQTYGHSSIVSSSCFKS